MRNEDIGGLRTCFMVLVVTMVFISASEFVSAAPSVGNVVLNSTLGTNLTSENLTVYTDQDNNASLKLIYNWKKNGSSIAVLNMPFEGGSTSTFTKDYSDSSNNGTVTGATWNSTGGYDGKGAYTFDGNDYISVGNDSELTSFNDFSLAAWFKTQGSPGGSFHSIIAKGGFLQEWLLLINPSQSSRVRFGVDLIDNDDTNFHSDATNLDDGNWHHVVAIKRGAFLEIYIDGQFSGNDLSEAKAIDDEGLNVTIGARAEGVENFFNGTIDEVYIFNYSLSTEQIKSLYGNRTDLIVSQDTRSGDIWEVEATPNDGTQDGTMVTSNNLTVGGTDPFLPTIIGVRVDQSSDDAEEAVDGPNLGDTEIDSTDLEMVDDPDFQQGNQTIGLRFQNIKIPRGAVINNAYIEFEVDETNNVSTNLSIYGEDEDNPDTFYFGIGNFNITPRTKTSAFASWNDIPAWNTISEIQRTTDIGNVVKEIVDRPGWVSGNSMVIIINGTGKRVAEAWDGESWNAPGLVVNWTENLVPTIDSLVLNSSLGTNLTSENLTAYAINVSDPENDTVKVIYNWKKDGSSIAVLNMPFEGGSTSTFTKDYSDNNKNGTVTSATYSSTGGYDSKGAYEFDAVDDYITLIDNESVPSSWQDIGNPSVKPNYTLSAWVKCGGCGPGGGSFSAPDAPVFEVRHVGSLNNAWAFGITNSKVSVGRVAGVASGERTNGTTVVNDNQWHYIVTVVKGDDVDFYVDGGFDATDSFTVQTGDHSRGTANSRVRIGVRTINSGDLDFTEAFNGTIDELKVYDFALSSQQISILYNNRTDLIVSQETISGEVWQVEATPNDGFQDGIIVLSNNLTILEAQIPSFNGTVKNLTGSLLPNSNVSVLGTSHSTVTLTGIYTITQDLSGLYDLVASKEGYLNQTKSDQLAEFDKTRQVDFNLGQLGGIKGDVLDFFNSTGIDNANLSLFLYDEFLKSTLTNSTGYYEFLNLAPGYYDINVTAAGYDPNSKPDNHVLGGENATVNFWLF